MNRIVFSIEVIKSLIKMDLSFYKRKYRDLKNFSDEILYKHYATYGYSEGRVCNIRALREHFIKDCSKLKCLEIGPFTNPTLKHNNVKYFDILGKADLQKRADRIARARGRPKKRIPDIDFVSDDGSLRVVDDSFDVVFSSHNLEHQPDIIKHLNEVSEILRDKGIYKMIVPNCAYCFDAALPPSKISEIILANKMKLTRHSLAKVIEHRALTVHNNSMSHWKEKRNNVQTYMKLDTSKINRAITEYETAKDSYIDVHSWQFMPHTLSDILQTLISLGFIAYTDIRCYGPAYGRNEFCIELIK